MLIPTGTRGDLGTTQESVHGQTTHTNHSMATNPTMGRIQLNPPKEITVDKIKKKEKEKAKDKEKAKTNLLAILKEDTNTKEDLLAKAKEKAKRKTNPNVTEPLHQIDCLWDRGQPQGQEHQRTKTLKLLT